MIVFDFIFYYLTYWFTKNKEKLSWSSPPERTTYAMGLMTMGLIYSISEYFELGNIKAFQFHIPKLALLGIGLFAIMLYDYIYIKRGRYQIIVVLVPGKFRISDDIGAVICIIITFLSILSPFIISTIFIPLGGQTLNK